MGRLTKYGKTSHDNGVCCTHFNSKECAELLGNCSYGCQWEEKVWEKLAHYEDLEEQGRLIELPFKIGDKVYTNFSMQGWYMQKKKRPYEAKIVFIGINGIDDIFNVELGEGKMLGFRFSDIGKTVFLTKEEAEAKLKEMRGAE